jgi:thioredoxin reductase
VPADREGVVVVGGGPAGLAAAIELRRLGVASVTVLEREGDPGGIPRHCDHTGFGLRDLRRVMSGPRYARRYAELAAAAGVELLRETMVTDLSGTRLGVTGPTGRTEISAAAVLLATGCRERPRSARLVPGSRPGGVMTTGTLQQLVHLRGERIGGRAVVVGAEHVSFSAIATLAHGGARAVALVTELPRHQSLGAFRLGASVRYRARVLTGTRLAAIRGERRVESVELEDLESGEPRKIECEIVVFTADWMPDHELAAMAGCELDPGTRGPRVDASLRTSVPGVFAAGNLIHPAETADVAALGGRHAAASVVEHLSAAGGEWPAQVPMEADPPLRWVAPNLLSTRGAPAARGRFLLRSDEFLRAPRLEVSQGGRRLWTGRLARLIPGRSAHIPAGWSRRLDPEAGPVRVRVR